MSFTEYAQFGMPLPPASPNAWTERHKNQCLSYDQGNGFRRRWLSLRNDFYVAFPSAGLIEDRATLAAGANDARVIESEVKGTTLRVYWEVFKSPRPVGVREVQRLIRFSSPSTALYHLEKLRELGVARKDEHGRYEVVEEIRPSQFRMRKRLLVLV
jgi:DNA-binding transcriptional ArsR family regulator